MNATADLQDLAAEHTALRQGCGLAERSWTSQLEMLGADRARFLNAYVTCDVKGLAAGQGAYGFFTSPQGRILADVTVLALEDRFWLELPGGAEAAVAAHLGKYLIADRVEMRPLAGRVAFTLAGPGAEAALAELLPDGELPGAAWSHRPATLQGTEVTVQRTGRMGVPALTLWVPVERGADLRAALLARPGVQAVGAAALEAVRVEAGMPRFGLDFGPANFPQETGAEEAVSYTKGCYLGQEVVARIHYRGGVQKTLCGLVFDDAQPGTQGDSLPAPGVPLLYEGREAGTLGSAIHSPALGRRAGLAILHRRAATPGSRIVLGKVEAVEGKGNEAEPTAEAVAAHATIAASAASAASAPAAPLTAEVRELPLVRP